MLCTVKGVISSITDLIEGILRTSQLGALIYTVPLHVPPKFSYDLSTTKGVIARGVVLYATNKQLSPESDDIGCGIEAVRHPFSNTPECDNKGRDNKGCDNKGCDSIWCDHKGCDNTNAK